MGQEEVLLALLVFLLVLRLVVLVLNLFLFLSDTLLPNAGT